MDGLRLALIIAGIVVVGAVYWWTARRRRMDREAGEFDRFDAWTDESLDPLSDEESITQPNPRFPVDPMADAPAEGGTLDDPGVLEGLEAIAESLETRREPVLGDVSGVSAQERRPAPSRPVSKPAPTAAPKSEPKPKPEAEPTVAPPAPARSGPPPKREPAQRAAPGAGPAAEPQLVMVINVMAPVGETFQGPALREALENAGLEAGDMKLYHFHTEAHSAGSAPIFSALNVIKPGTLDPAQFEGMRTPGIALVMRLPGPERPSEAFELMHGTATRMVAELGGRLCDETRSALTRQALNLMRERIADLVRRQRARG